MDKAREYCCKVVVHMLICVWDALVLLELVMAKLVCGHRDAILLGKNASLSLAIASAAVGDCHAILQAVLACRQADIPTLFMHLGAEAGVLLLRVIGTMWLLGGPISLGVILHPLLQFGIKCHLLVPQIIDANKGYDCSLAFAEGQSKLATF
jgi:hypothetical protein